MVCLDHLVRLPLPVYRVTERRIDEQLRFKKCLLFTGSITQQAIFPPLPFTP